MFELRPSRLGRSHQLNYTTFILDKIVCFTAHHEFERDRLSVLVVARKVHLHWPELRPVHRIITERAALPAILGVVVEIRQDA